MRSEPVSFEPSRTVWFWFHAVRERGPAPFRLPFRTGQGRGVAAGIGGGAHGPMGGIRVQSEVWRAQRGIWRIRPLSGAFGSIWPAALLPQNLYVVRQGLNPIARYLKRYVDRVMIDPHKGCIPSEADRTTT